MIRPITDTAGGIVLTGLDGSNPLAFLAALGTLLTVRIVSPNALLSWVEEEGTWRPCLWGTVDEPAALIDQIAATLTELSMAPFHIEKKMPFPLSQFRECATQATADMQQRRFVDFLASFGSDAFTDGENFEDTFFRMVRSGDSAGQGFLYYALTIRKNTSPENLEQTLFGQWLYQDQCFSLRWDPMEDSQYALRWEDPSKSDKNTMVGANSLALEALQLLPTHPAVNRLQTTGFHTQRRREYFTWPIWNAPLSVDMIRSLLSLATLHEETPSRHELRERGVQEVFRARRYAPNQYYRNFTPARSI